MLPALEAATKAPSHLPAVRVRLYDKRGNVVRPRFTSLYAGAEEDNFHAACFAGDGSLVRARLQAASPDYALFRSRVANPGPSSDYSQWLYSGAVSTSSKTALASSGSNVLLFTLHVDDLTIRVKESTDNGVTWGDWCNVCTAASTPGYLAAAFNSDGSVCVLFYNIGGVVYAVCRAGGSWSEPSAWSNSLADVTGISAIFDADWKLAVCGQDSSGRKGLWVCSYTISYNWAALQEVMAADAGTAISFYYPSLGKPSPYMLFFLENFSGSESYQQVRWSATAASGIFSENLWLEPIGFSISTPYGYDLIHGSGYLWVVGANRVLRSGVSPGLVDLSGDVVSVNVDTTPDGAWARVALRNDAGQYDTPPLGLGAQLEIEWGYQTPILSGCYTDPVGYWVERLEYSSRGPLCTLILHCSDAWGVLRSLRARYQYVWQSGTASIRNMLKWLLGRAGIAMSVLSCSSAFTSQTPAFTVNAGEDYATAIRRLLVKVPDVFFFRGSTACVLNPLPGDPSEYSYGLSHAILEGHYVGAAAGFNSFAVFGHDVTTYDWDWNGVEKVWERLVQIRDNSLTSVSAAHERGAAELRRAAMDSSSGVMVVPLHPGQELCDVIDITDPRSGLSAAKRRVVGLAHRYDTRRGECNLLVRLAGV